MDTDPKPASAATARAAIDSEAVTAPLGAEPLAGLLSLLDRFDFWFEIVTP